VYAARERPFAIASPALPRTYLVIDDNPAPPRAVND
jgi:hypothetical protein